MKVPGGRLAVWWVPPVVVLLVVWLGLGGTTWDPQVPISFGGDGLFYLAQTKSTLDHGWWWVNPSLGLPAEYHALIFAQNTNVDQAIVWLVGRFTREVGLAVNVTWLVMLALGAVTTTWGLRRLGASRLSAGTAGILFALSPFAFYRHIGHFSLVMYLVPFPATAALVLATASRDRHWHWKDLAVPIAGCALVGLNYIYYAFFGAALVMAGLVIGYGRTRSATVLKAGAACLGAIVLATFLNLLPSVFAWREHGDLQVPRKLALESEVYGLKIRHLISPIEGHWFPPFQAWLDRDRAGMFGWETENIRARLGLVATVGWLGLMAVLILPASRAPDRDGDAIPAAARLTVAALLLGIVGGLGSLFALLVAPDIRAYNRIAPFLAFFALAAVALWIDRMTLTRPRRLRAAISVLAIVIGVSDLPPIFSGLVASRPSVTGRWNAVRAFISDLEARLPERAMVFQLPLRPYPSDPGIGKMGVYEHFEPYLTSRHLRWSYPILTRDQAMWERGVYSRPEADWPALLAEAGFSAILINRAAYPDQGQALVAALRSGAAGATVLAEGASYIALDLRR